MELLDLQMIRVPRGDKTDLLSLRPGQQHPKPKSLSDRWCAGGSMRGILYARINVLLPLQELMRSNSCIRPGSYCAGHKLRYASEE